MRKAIDRSFSMRLALTVGLSVALMTASIVPVRADTVIGTDGAPGVDCDPLGDPSCVGGNGGDGESVIAYGNPAAAYGGDGGRGGLGGGVGNQPYFQMGFGGDGGSATAVAEASAASGPVIASAMAVGGRDGGYIFGDTLGGDATASATAISGDVTVSATAMAAGFINPFPYPGPNASASAYSVALPDKADVAAILGSGEADALLGPEDIVFGIAILDISDFGLNDYYSTTATLTVSGRHDGLFLVGPDVGFGPFDQTAVTVYGPGTYVLYGAIPEPSTWAMMLIGFAGLGFGGYRASRRNAATGLRA